MINNLGLYSATFNNNSTVSQQNTAEIQAITDKHADSSVKSEESAVVDNSLYLSSRAQKINAISSEFFSGAELTFDDVGALKEKLYQFGLISKGEYATLGGTTTDATTSESSANTSTTTLTNFLGDFIERLNKDDDADGDTDSDEKVTESETIVALTGALTTAKKILNNVEEQKLQTDFKTSLKGALALLKETINDKSFEKLPLDDKIGLSKVHQALEIVDRLSPQRLNNDKVNQYIKLSYR
ncbi:hypothetical protein ESZ36_03870 [Colwellia demingiae]|uniref:Uncharacterized protein n=1 Tax=Colwellia demingiae TaxID=89401 RepID=A0A5C6QQ15_9GAMM|nr:hypothetical protein [Colwellia demingiae]TWX70801.1 hypothetical protein ESZ36_03870 [Colwellia demingiae]